MLSTECSVGRLSKNGAATGAVRDLGLQILAEKPVMRLLGGAG